MSDRIDLRSILIAIGALLLLLSLFLAWYEPGLEAWSVFELVDVLLAAIALLALVATLSPAARGLRRAVPWLGAAALVLVAVQVIDPPPAVAGSERAEGAWLALVGALLMAIGAALSVARISVVVDVQGRPPGAAGGSDVGGPGAAAGTGPELGGPGVAAGDGSPRDAASRGGLFARHDDAALAATREPPAAADETDATRPLGPADRPPPPAR